MTKPTTINGTIEASNLNEFFVHVEQSDIATTSPGCPGSPGSPTLFSEEGVSKVFKAVKANNATGPGRIPPRLLKSCTNALVPACVMLFNPSLEERKVSDVWKFSIYVPVPKVSKPVVMNDFRPFELRSALMKCMERLMRRRLTAEISSQMDPVRVQARKKR